MATFRKRGPFQWQSIIRRKGYPQQSATFETKQEAMAWAATIESKMMRGVWLDDGDASKTTLKESIDRYRKDVTPSKKGADQEQSKLNVLERSTLAESYMTNIRSKDVADYRNHRLQKVKANTIRNELNLLSAIFNTARKEWGMESLRNPVADVARPTPDKGRDRRLREGEEEMLLEAAKCNRSPYIYPAVILAIETAMRAGEVSSLRWENIEFTDAESGIAHLPETKNGESRDVPLFPRAVEALKSMPRRMDGKVFSYSDDPKIKAFSKAFASLRKQTKDKDGNDSPIVGLRLHDLRHEAISRLFEMGFSAEYVMTISGHKCHAMTQRYTHLKAEDMLRMHKEFTAMKAKAETSCETDTINIQ